MKIQNINNYANYNCNSKSVKNEETAKIKNYDVIDIKSKTEDGSKTDDIASIKRKIAAEINGGTKASKLMKIKNSIDNNDYHVDVDEIVRKMLL